jgi:hypothetical protein
MEQMDATVNEAEGLKIEGFPTLMFYPANNKKDPIKYSGERTVRQVAKRMLGSPARIYAWGVHVEAGAHSGGIGQSLTQSCCCTPQVADFSAFVKEHASKPITRELSVGAVKAEKVPHPSYL